MGICPPGGTCGIKGTAGGVGAMRVHPFPQHSARIDPALSRELGQNAGVRVSSPPVQLRQRCDDAGDLVPRRLNDEGVAVTRTQL